MADNPEGRQNHDIDFRVTEEPEQVLEQDRVATALRLEEIRTEITVGQQHGNRAAKYRHSQHQQERRHQHRPNKERHFVQRHTRCTHIENRGDEIRRAEN